MMLFLFCHLFRVPSRVLSVWRQPVYGLSGKAAGCVTDVKPAPFPGFAFAGHPRHPFLQFPAGCLRLLLSDGVGSTPVYTVPDQKRRCHKRVFHMSGIGFQCLQFHPFFMQPIQIRSGRTGTEAFEDLLYGPGQPGIHFKDIGHGTFPPLLPVFLRIHVLPAAGTVRSLWKSRSVHGYLRNIPAVHQGPVEALHNFAAFLRVGFKRVIHGCLGLTGYCFWRLSYGWLAA